MRLSPKSMIRDGLGLAVVAAVVGIGVFALLSLRHEIGRNPGAAEFGKAVPVGLQPLQTDPLDGGVAWLNTGGPIKLRELRGKIVILDFWTYCCINCHHVLPDLEKLEEKYKNQLVVIGVHTPKFAAERDVENVRQKVKEYRIKHPVVCDSDQVIWNRFGVNSWPTIGVFDPEGNVAYATAGEGHYDALDRVVGDLVTRYRQKGTLNETPVQFFPENEKPTNTPLLFPGKILADLASDRLFISDTGHNRLVATDLSGKNPVIIGVGSAGLADGSYGKAEFNRPQGMALVGEVLYVADTENHAIRAIDLKAKTVKTVAGTGQQGRMIARGETTMWEAAQTSLNSPWDLVQEPGGTSLFVAMAGPHQIWKFDATAGKIGAWAGTGMENIFDGPIASAAFAQPSGLATDGKTLYVADSEVSALRAINLEAGPPSVRSIVGEGLFEFGDVDGQGAEVRLQHCLGVAWGNGALYVADTYNNKIKICDPKKRAVESLVGTGKPGGGDAPAAFYQPGGISVAGDRLFVADTNNHKVRVVDLKSKSVSTLDLALQPPSPPRRKPVFLNATALQAGPATAAPGRELTLNVTLPIPEGFKLNAEGSQPYLVETPGKTGLIDFPDAGEKLDKPASHFTIRVPLAKPSSAGETLDLKVSVMSLVCSEGSNLCTIKSFVWNLPVVFREGSPTQVELGATR